MNKGKIVKIAGFLVIPIVLMLVVVYLLYPMINEDKYDLIIRTNGMMYDSLALDSLTKIDSLISIDSMHVADSPNLDTPKTIEVQKNPNIVTKIDSLERMIYLLTTRLEGLEMKEKMSKVPQQSNNSDNDYEEAFKDRVKSLLNLEEDEMAPILDKMTSKQLVRLYKEAGNTQREKILRALKSDQAARLITEVML
jgi:transcriptional regulator of heat shock response